MNDCVLIETFNFKAEAIARRWKNFIRKESQLKHYNRLSDEQLCELNAPLYPQLARSIERGIDRKHIGAYFVGMGKDRMRMGFPVSEVVFACSLSQKAVVDYISFEFVHDNPLALYQAFSAIEKVNEFFFLGCFYVIKGFLEQTYESMNNNHKIPEELLKTYFKDDFFFKKDVESIT
ncbi:MAG: hypothetical protein LBD86_00660 [Spirochaetaceae bacterium]|jgi:hypothetical protein|nr:hypothetical protein [Spirochaetaceae bacterium]